MSFDDHQECPICYNLIKERNRVITNCGHVFCLNCITQHTISIINSSPYQNQNIISDSDSNTNTLSCPICRSSFVDKDKNNLNSNHVNSNHSNNIYDVSRDLSILSQILLDKIEDLDPDFYNRWYPWFNQRLESLETINMLGYGHQHADNDSDDDNNDNPDEDHLNHDSDYDSYITRPFNVI